MWARTWQGSPSATALRALAMVSPMNILPCPFAWSPCCLCFAATCRRHAECIARLRGPLLSPRAAPLPHRACMARLYHYDRSEALAQSTVKLAGIRRSDDLNTSPIPSPVYTVGACPTRACMQEPGGICRSHLKSQARVSRSFWPCFIFADLLFHQLAGFVCMSSPVAILLFKTHNQSPTSPKPKTPPQSPSPSSPLSMLNALTAAIKSK